MDAVVKAGLVVVVVMVEMEVLLVKEAAMEDEEETVGQLKSLLFCPCTLLILFLLLSSCWCRQSPSCALSGSVLWLYAGGNGGDGGHGGDGGNGARGGDAGNGGHVAIYAADPRLLIMVEVRVWRISLAILTLAAPWSICRLGK